MSAAPHLDPVGRVIDKLRDLGCQPKQAGPGQWTARCPHTAGHKNGDKNPSLSVGTGPDGKALLHCHGGCGTPDIARALDLGVSDLFPPRPQSTIGEGRRIVAHYNYYDADGELVFQVVRYRPKDFRQRKPDPGGIGWVWNIGDIAERPLYMLPQVRRAIAGGMPVYMCEGEKDAEALQWVIDGAATCNSGGATKWRDEYARQLQGARRIILIQDNDAAGIKHVKTFAAKLLLAGYGDVTVIAPPAPHNDTAQALGAGRDIASFVHVWDNSEDMSWLTIAEPDSPDDDEAHTDDFEADDNEWQPIDLVAIARQIIDGTYQPTMPTVLDVENGMPLFYKERVNLLFGESGGGKTWIALAAIAATVAVGRRALMIDYEDNPNGIAERLVALGVTLEQMRNLDYINPTQSMSSGWEALADTPHVYDLVVLDSTGEAMAAGGVNSNDDGEVAQWFAIVKKFLRLPGKPAVITLDHVPKNQEGQLLFSIGSQRKRAAITGASYRVDTIKEPAKGKDGELKLTVAKDRPGNRPKNTIACHIEMRSLEGGRLEVVAVHKQPSLTDDGKFRPTGYMQRVSNWLDFHPKASARDIRDGVTGKTTVVNEALAVLVAEGYVKVEPGPRGASMHTLVRPYSEAADDRLSAQTTTNSVPGSRFPVVPSGSREPVPNAETSGSRFPPLTGEPGNQSDRGQNEPLSSTPNVVEENFGSLEPDDWF